MNHALRLDRETTSTKATGFYHETTILYYHDYSFLEKQFSHNQDVNECGNFPRACGFFSCLKIGSPPHLVHVPSTSSATPTGDNVYESSHFPFLPELICIMARQVFTFCYSRGKLRGFRKEKITLPDKIQFEKRGKMIKKKKVSPRWSAGLRLSTYYCNNL